ncbi:hypothetical protein [Helicobacter pylori]|uniref:hypothetical protein n=1 Tax=Helicobacter pylori TaxID=210 RepID=UPI001F0BFE09|nr:hypothetical protein [Helicobacter pylori]
MHEVKEAKGKLQVVLTLEEANNPRKKQQLIIANASQVEKLKAMHERYEQKFFTQNASKILKNKDGKGLAYAQQIKENLKKGMEEDKPIEATPNTKEIAKVESMKKTLGGLFSNHIKKIRLIHEIFFMEIPKNSQKKALIFKFF